MMVNYKNYNVMEKTINNITIEEAGTAARENSEKYIDRFKKMAERAFIEGVVWAQKVQRENRIL